MACGVLVPWLGIEPLPLQWRCRILTTGPPDAEAGTPILWRPDTKNWLIGKDPDAGKDWRQEETGMTEDEMVGWHHWLDGHEFEQAPGDGEGWGSLACCSPWGRKEPDAAEQLNNSNMKWWYFDSVIPSLFISYTVPKKRSFIYIYTTVSIPFSLSSHGAIWIVSSSLILWMMLLLTVFACPFIYFGCTGSSWLHTVSGCGEQGLLSSSGTRAFHCGGFSCCRAWAQEHKGVSTCCAQT